MLVVRAAPNLHLIDRAVLADIRRWGATVGFDGAALFDLVNQVSDGLLAADALWDLLEVLHEEPRGETRAYWFAASTDLVVVLEVLRPREQLVDRSVLLASDIRFVVDQSLSGP